MNTSGGQARLFEYIGIAAAVTTFFSALEAFRLAVRPPPVPEPFRSFFRLRSTQKEMLDKEGSNIVKSVWLMSPPAAAAIFRKAMIAHDKGKPAAR